MKRQGQESTAAGPIGTHDGDDNPEAITGDNFSNPPEFTNENSQLNPHASTDSTPNPRSRLDRERVQNLMVHLDSELARMRQTELAERRSMSCPEFNPRLRWILQAQQALTPPHGSRNVRPRVHATQRPQISMPTQFVQPGQQYESEIVGPSGTHVGDNTSPSPYPSTFQPYGTPTIHLPAHDSQVGPSIRPGNYHQRGMQPQLPRPHGVQFQPGPQDLPDPHTFHNFQYHPPGYHGNMPPEMPTYLRGFPLHDQPHENRPTAQPAVRAIRPQPRRGGRTASISQQLGQPRPRGHWRPASSQTVAVHHPPPEPQPRPERTVAVERFIHQIVDPVTRTVIGERVLSRTIDLQPPLPKPEPEPESQPLSIPSSDNVMKPDGRRCPVCERDVALPAPGKDFQPGNVPNTVLLDCGHRFHLECWRMVIAERSLDNPIPCIGCRKGDET